VSQEIREASGVLYEEQGAVRELERFLHDAVATTPRL
jgi:hypothetical protein